MSNVKFVEPVNDPVKAKNDPVNDQVNDSVKSKILQHLKQNPKANYRELADKTGFSTATIKRHIQELKKMRIIERIGSDKTGYWKIVD
ncbi:MAG: winged helix-turn-helix transcriptional regulator [Bacteroidales bacterium]|nr:winged helix-turn-helix transcriptional regulator [Bacteroidales bacterium]